MGNIKYLSAGIENLDVIKPLWEKLREHHAEKTQYFREDFLGATFEKRTSSIIERNKTGRVKIDLVVEEVSELPVGYCISSITESGEAEIDSIFVSKDFRGYNIGDELMKRAIEWIKSQGVEKIKISVAHGNDDVLNFYEKHGFYPRTYILYNK